MKKLTSLVLSLLLIIAAMSPAYAAEPVLASAESNVSEVSTADGTSESKGYGTHYFSSDRLALIAAILMQLDMSADDIDSQNEQFAIVASILHQICESLTTEETMGQLYKTVSGLKPEVKEISLSAQEFLTIIFYVFEDVSSLSVEESGTTVQLVWTYSIKDKEQLRIFWAPETACWSLGTNANAKMVSIK